MNDTDYTQKRNPYLAESGQRSTAARKRLDTPDVPFLKRNTNASHMPIHGKRQISRRKKKKKSYFYRNLIIFTLISVILIFLCFIRLWNFLIDYQNTLPSMLGEQILTAYQSGDTSTIKKYCKNIPDVFQDDLTFHDYLIHSLDRDSLYYYESSSDSSSITYTICTNDKTFATLVLSKTDEKSKYGFPVYQIHNLEQYSLGNTTYVQAPGTKLLVNGNAIDDSLITEQTEVATCFQQIEVAPFYTTTYVLPDYLSASNVTCITDSGETCNISWNEEHSIGTSIYPISEEMKQSLSDFSVNAAKEYAIFATLKNAPRDTLLTYLLRNTDFYKAILKYDTDWGITKTADSFDNIEVSDYISYTDTEYSCIVSFKYLVKQGNAEKTFPLSYTCYITTEDNQFKIIYLETNTSS